MNTKDILATVNTILVIDWPSKDVPESLARAGFQVVVRGGPGPEDYSIYEFKDGQVRPRHLGRRPERAELVYSYRPLGELPGIIADAKALGARSIWTQSGLAGDEEKDPTGCWLPEDELRRARALVESAGLNHISEPYIGDAVRAMCSSRQ